MKKDLAISVLFFVVFLSGGFVAAEAVEAEAAAPSETVPLETVVDRLVFQVDSSRANRQVLQTKENENPVIATLIGNLSERKAQFHCYSYCNEKVKATKLNEKLAEAAVRIPGAEAKTPESQYRCFLELAASKRPGVLDGVCKIVQVFHPIPLTDAVSKDIRIGTKSKIIELP